MYMYICYVLDLSSLFPHCKYLEELGLPIQMVVCQPTPQKAVQVIAQPISDRDTNVRNAALNTLVVVYDNIGENVYKYAGQVSILCNKAVTGLSKIIYIFMCNCLFQYLSVLLIL